MATSRERYSSHRKRQPKGHHMTRDELKIELYPLVTKIMVDEDALRLLAPIAQRWLADGDHDDIEDAFDIYNTVMAEIVEEHQIRRH